MKTIAKTIQRDALTSIGTGTIDGCMYLECFYTKTGELLWSHVDDKG